MKSTWSIGELVRYGSMLGYTVQKAKGKGNYQIKELPGEIFKNHELVNLIIFLDSK